MQRYLNFMFITMLSLLIMNCALESKLSVGNKDNRDKGSSTDSKEKKIQEEVIAFEKELAKEYKKTTVQFIKEAVNDDNFTNLLKEAINTNQMEEVKELMQIIETELTSYEKSSNKKEKDIQDLKESLIVVFQKAKTPADILKLQFESSDSK